MKFSDQDKELIVKAVKEAESRTSGEIVPLILNASDGYIYADLIGGIIGQIIFLIAGFWIFREFDPWKIVAIQAAGFVVGFLKVRYIPFVKRTFLAEKIVHIEVYQRAVQAFHEHGLMNTRDRTGILIMVSMLERRVQVLADSGIHSKVEDGTWDEVVKIILDGIGKGSVIDGLIAGIEHCGEILARHFPIKSDDTDELPDDLLTE